MNKMTEYQCKLVEENLDIIDWVIRCRVKVNGQVLQTYEDFYQIGCEALCERLWPITRKEGPFLRWAADMSIMRSLITAGSKICFSSIMLI